MQYAYDVMQDWKEQDELQKDDIYSDYKVDVVKNRSGPTDHAHLKFTEDFVRFDDWGGGELQ